MQRQGEFCAHSCVERLGENICAVAEIKSVGHQKLGNVLVVAGCGCTGDRVFVAEDELHILLIVWIQPAFALALRDSSKP